MIKTLVTGAAGFLGSYLSEQLLKKDYEVIGVDNFFRGKKEYLPTDKQFTFYKLNLVSQADKIVTLIKNEKPEIIFHYAAINGTKYFYDLPYMVFYDNIAITQHLLQACKKSKVKKIVFASSSEVYGEPFQVPTPETHPILLNPFNVRDSYSSSKAICEFYIKLFALQHNLDFLILRIFNTYGPHMDTSQYGQVIPEFIYKATHDQQFTIIGNGQNTRSFCHVSDHSWMAVKLAERISNEIVNIGNDTEISINDLAKTIHQLLGKTFTPLYLPSREFDPKRRCPDISKLKKLINDYPKISLEDGLKKTINAYR